MVFWHLSNPVHSYVKCWRVHASFGEDLWCLKRAPDEEVGGSFREKEACLELLTRKEVVLGQEVPVSVF